MRWVWRGLCALALALAGCSEELAPLRMQTTSVVGSVTLSGRPVGPGWLEFQPIDGTIGLLTSARLNRDGTYRAERVPVGRVAIRLVGLRPIQTRDPEIHYGLALLGQRYLIHRSVGAQPGSRLDIDLYDDAKRAGAQALAGAR